MIAYSPLASERSGALGVGLLAVVTSIGVHLGAVAFVLVLPVVLALLPQACSFTPLLPVVQEVEPIELAVVKLPEPVTEKVEEVAPPKAEDASERLAETKPRKDAGRIVRKKREKRVASLEAKMGVLALIGASSGEGELASVFGSADLDGAVLGGLMGAELSEAHGAGGLGLRGTGGGGTGEGTIGLGSVGSLGRGGGGGGAGYGRGAGGMASRARVSLGEVHASGEISVDVARRAVRRGFYRLRSCTLGRDELPASMSLSLSVDDKGAVSEARVRGTDGGLASCLASKARQLAFPRGPASVEVALAIAD